MSILCQQLAFMSLGSSAGALATFNPSDKGTGLSLSGGDLVVSQTVGSTWRSVRATVGKSTGKAVFEMSFSSVTANLASGFADGGASMATFLGGSAKSVAVRSSGFTTNGITTAGSVPTGSTNPYMYALDMDNGKGWVAVGNVWANSGDPAAGTNPSFTWTPGTLIYPGASVFTTGGITVTLNAGQSAFSNTVPSGFTSEWRGS